LQSNYEIAKCREVSAGSKGKPYSKEEVDKILSENRQVCLPAERIIRQAATDNHIKDMLLEQDQGSSN